MKLLYTIGYEDSCIDDVLLALSDAGTTLLVDVREVAASRKKGFSKTLLKSNLEKVGISYIHLRALGDPKPGREAAKKGYLNEFRRIYGERLKTEAALDQLSVLAHLTQSETVCLLCYEAEAKDCHRSIVAAKIATDERVAIKHLQPKFSGSQSAARTYTNINKSSAAPLH